MSPYYLLLGREPIMPVDAPKLLTETVTAGAEEKWVAVAEDREKYLRDLLPPALENLHVAQLRDAQRYKQRGENACRRRQPSVEPGAEVYMKQAHKDMLDVGLATEMWRVKEVKESGVIVLENDKGRERTDHVTNTARARTTAQSKQEEAEKR
ncbi:unnamed protein product [Closterium sp. NIES-54]